MGLEKEVLKKPDQTTGETADQDIPKTTPADIMTEKPSADTRTEAPPADTSIQGNGETSNTQLPGVPGKALQSLQSGVDEIDQKMASLAQRTGAVQNLRDTEPEGNSVFDTLPVEWDEKSDGGEKPAKCPDDLWELKKKIGELRGGNLYQAVLVAKELQSGRSNPMATGRTRRYLSGAGRISSIALDTASDANKAFASTVAIASTIDKEGKYKSALQGAALISNFISMVTTSRDIFLKIKNFKGGSGVDKLFKAIALCGDFAMLMSKACSIAKTITGYFVDGKRIPILKETIKWLTLALNMGSQLAGISNASRAVHVGRQKLKKLRENESRLWDTQIKQILKDHGCLEEASEENDVENDQEADGQKEPDKETGQTEETAADVSRPEETKDAEPHSGASKELSGSAREKAVERLLSNPNHLKEEEKDTLIQYLAVTRRADKLNTSLITTSSGLITSVIGLCSSLFTATVYGASYSEKAASKMPGVGTAGMSVITNSATIGNLVTKTAIKVKSGGKDARTDLISDRLWSKLDTLGEDAYGLKGLEEELSAAASRYRDVKDSKAEPVNGEEIKEKKDKAGNALSAYEKTDTQFQDLGVDYGALLKAHDQDAFKKILAAGV